MYPPYRKFAQLPEYDRLPDESTILRFRHRLQAPYLAGQILATVNALLGQRSLLLKAGTVVGATLIAAPTSTKNKDKSRDPEMHSSKKGNQWYFGMKAHVGADAEPGLVHSVRATAGHVSGIAEGNALLRGLEAAVFAMQATRALKRARMPGRRFAGTSRCAWANAVRWTKTTGPMS